MDLPMASGQDLIQKYTLFEGQGDQHVPYMGLNAR